MAKGHAGGDTTASKYASARSSSIRRGSFGIQHRGSTTNSLTLTKGSGADDTAKELTALTGRESLSDESGGINLRVRSDSVVLDARRRHGLSSNNDAHDTQAHPSQPQRPRRRQRLSLGTTALGPSFRLDHKRREGFFDVFGLLGIPMLVFFLSTSLAVFLQACIQVYPTSFANYLMDTATYDSGEFWMLPDPEPAPTVIATALLVAFAGFYLYLAAFMVFFRHHGLSKNKRLCSVTSASSKTRSNAAGHSRRSGRFPELNSRQLFRLLVPVFLSPEQTAKAVVSVPASTVPSTTNGEGSAKNVMPVGNGKEKRKPPSASTVPVREIYKQFVSPNGVYNAYYNVLYDAPKLIFQSITLLAYLRKGFPISLTAFYASLLTFNYLISFYRFQRKRIDHQLTITRLFYLFDLFFAAFAPIVVLLYAYYNFHFDRDVYQTKLEALSPGIFDRIARLYADPVEISVFRLAFGSLRLTTASTIFTKCSLLLLSVFKWHKIIVYLVQTNHVKQHQMSGHYPQVFKHANSRRHLFCGVFVFAFFGMAIVVYTAGSIMTSMRHCQTYQEHCVVISYHWIFPGESCPCLVYISRRTDPRTFAEWEDPPEVTDELSHVARMGELKVIQIINRKLPVLPDTLRACTQLEQLILIYSKTEVVPEWANELTYLQYLHIEGDFTSSLATLPLNIFKDMKKLTYLHTGVVPRLTEYPSLDGLVNLQTLAIAVPHAMQKLPSFAHLTNLRELLLVELGTMQRLPSLQSLKKIKHIGIFYRATICCNGFLSAGVCDLTNYQCLPRVDEPIVECVNDTVSQDDAALLKRVGSPICPDWQSDLREMAPTRESTDVACGGVLFRQCSLGNATGICYNGRMQVVNCDTAGELERMRRLQIQRQVGIPCDPNVEAWLGCKQES